MEALDALADAERDIPALRAARADRARSATALNTSASYGSHCSPFDSEALTPFEPRLSRPSSPPEPAPHPPLTEPRPRTTTYLPSRFARSFHSLAHPSRGSVAPQRARRRAPPQVLDRFYESRQSASSAETTLTPCNRVPSAGRRPPRRRRRRPRGRGRSGPGSPRRAPRGRYRGRRRPRRSACRRRNSRGWWA